MHSAKLFNNSASVSRLKERHHVHPFFSAWYGYQTAWLAIRNLDVLLQPRSPEFINLENKFKFKFKINHQS